jgi:hypothetical protein
LIIVGLVVAWLVVLVPMVARKRQEVARTAEATPAAPEARRDETSSSVEEEFAMPDAGHTETAPAQPEGVAAAEDGYELEDGYDDGYDEYLDDEPTPRPYRPGRGGFDAETAARVARAKYAFRQRVVLLLLLGAVGTAVAAVAVTPLIWWAHGALDLTLVGYLSYLRRQVRIEEDVRARRLARLQAARRPAPRREPRAEAEPEAEALAAVAVVEEEPRSALTPRPAVQPTQPRPGTVVVDLDDEDPVFVELDGPGRMPYRRAAGE